MTIFPWTVPTHCVWNHLLYFACFWCILYTVGSFTFIQYTQFVQICTLCLAHEIFLQPLFAHGRFVYLLQKRSAFISQFISHFLGSKSRKFWSLSYKLWFLFYRLFHFWTFCLLFHDIELPLIFERIELLNFSDFEILGTSQGQ